MKVQQPPKLARRIFDWYCGYAKVEDLRGDLEELFFYNAKTKSLNKAKLIYWKQVLSLISSYAIRKRKKDSQLGPFAPSSFSLSMLENYLKVASRSLFKHKYFSIVNVIGLAIGMSVGLLFIALYGYVGTYDDFHERKSDIYRVTTLYEERTEQLNLASAPTILADKLDLEYAEIEETVRINSDFSDEVIEGKLNIPIRGYYTEPSFFSVFSFTMLAGSSSTALSKPNTIVLTESAAKKIFNTASVLGRTFVLSSLGNIEVTGVVKDPPQNSHMKFEALVSRSTLPMNEQGENTIKRWKDFAHQYIYLRVSDRSKTKRLQQSIRRIFMQVGNPLQAKISFQLQALADITPTKNSMMMNHDLGPIWDDNALIAFGLISILVLLPACFNYTNISIARALKRSKEIGLRKTMGGLKSQIFFQFITETIVITFVSLIGAFLLFITIRSEFQNTLLKDSSVNLGLTWEMAGMFLLFAVFTAVLSGAVPALYFSGLNPIQALKNQSNKHSFSGAQIRKALTIFQFALSFGFIMTPIVLIRQYRYSLNFDFGFEKKNILDVELQSVEPEEFKTVFSRFSEVQSLSMSSGIMGLGSELTCPHTWVHGLSGSDSSKVYQMYVDHQYIENMELSLLAGVTFPDRIWHREQFIIVNEEFLKAKNIQNPSEAIGQTYRIEGKDLEVIGVLKNFHFTSLRSPIKSFMFRTDPDQFAFANLKVSFADAHASLSEMEKAWGTLIDGRKFHARFYEDEISDAYDSYRGLLQIFGYLGLLTISISLLGLLGMVVYTSETKTKEVGIRKVLGATTSSITALLSKDYLKLILWAVGIAIPVTFFLLDNILPRMQYYGVTPGVWDVILSLITLLIMGLATIVSQTFKTASTNPAETLRCE